MMKGIIFVAFIFIILTAGLPYAMLFLIGYLLAVCERGLRDIPVKEILEKHAPLFKFEVDNGNVSKEVEHTEVKGGEDTMAEKSKPTKEKKKKKKKK